MRSSTELEFKTTEETTHNSRLTLPIMAVQALSFETKRAWRDSNPRPLEPESNALSTAPHALSCINIQYSAVHQCIVIPTSAANLQVIIIMLLKSTVIGILKNLLPRRIRNALFHLAFNIAHPEFEKFAFHYANAPNMKYGLQAICDRGFSPKSIVDVGAFEGEWSKIARSIWPNARLEMVEPNEKQYPILTPMMTTLKAHLHQELLGAEEGQEAAFYIMGSGSSIFEERGSISQNKEIRRLKTLDTILPDLDGIDLLKIDAQGYELEILKGAERLLPKTAAIILEVALIQMNQGAPLLHEVLTFMKARGFISYEILEFHRRLLDGALVQIDILFIREGSHLVSDKRFMAD
jgi:FkbM family methyltransferase